MGSIDHGKARGWDDASSGATLRRRNRLRILVAEDDDEMRALLVQVLERQGYDVIEAADGSELIDFVGLAMGAPDCETVPDVIISDHRMPGWSGLEVLAGVRSLGSAVPFILITAFGNAMLRDQAMRMGATAVIDKPVEMDFLRALLERLDGRSRRSLAGMGRREPVRVLLAEDDGEMRRFLASLLRRDGFEVVEAASGSEMLEILGTSLLIDSPALGFDIIVSDVRMPGWNGMEVLAGIRRAGWSIPFVVMTAFADRETLDHAVSLGAAAFFSKPLDVDCFRDVLLEIALSRIFSGSRRT